MPSPFDILSALSIHSTPLNVPYPSALKIDDSLPTIHSQWKWLWFRYAYISNVYISPGGEHIYGSRVWGDQNLWFSGSRCMQIPNILIRHKTGRFSIQSHFNISSRTERNRDKQTSLEDICTYLSSDLRSLTSRIELSKVKFGTKQI